MTVEVSASAMNVIKVLWRIMRISELNVNQRTYPRFHLKEEREIKR